MIYGPVRKKVGEHKGNGRYTPGYVEPLGEEGIPKCYYLRKRKQEVKS